MLHTLAAPETLVAVSLETTGLNPLRDRITEVGAVRFDYEGALLDTFWERSDPGVAIPVHIRKITGVTDKDVAGARTPEAVVKDFFAWAGRATWLVAHSGEFEAAFLHTAAGGQKNEDEDRCVLSTLRWARRAELGTPDCRLGTLLEHIRYDIRVWPLHGTLIGAQGVADLTVFLLKRSYADPSHAGVKDLLALRADRLHGLFRLQTTEWARRTRPPRGAGRQAPPAAT